MSGHFSEVGAFATQQIFHGFIAVGFAAAEEIHIFPGFVVVAIIIRFQFGYIIIAKTYTGLYTKVRGKNDFNHKKINLKRKMDFMDTSLLIHYLVPQAYPGRNSVPRMGIFLPAQSRLP